MRVFIKDVEIGAYYEPKIYSFWINGILKSGKEIKIFDSGCLDLRNYIGQELDLLMFASSNGNENENSSNTFEGFYLNSYNIPAKWLKLDKRLGEGNKTVLKTKDGIFRIYDLKCLKYENLDYIKYNVARFDLDHYLPIEKETQEEHMSDKYPFLPKEFEKLEEFINWGIKDFLNKINENFKKFKEEKINLGQNLDSLLEQLLNESVKNPKAVQILEKKDNIEKYQEGARLYVIDKFNDYLFINYFLNRVSIKFKRKLIESALSVFFDYIYELYS